MGKDGLDMKKAPGKTPSEPKETTPGTGDSPGTQPGDGGTEDGTPVTFTAEQQTAIDSLIGDRLKRAKEKWESDAAAQQKKAEEEAEQKRLKEQAEWQKLAEQHEAKVSELEPQVASQAKQLKAYQAAVDGMLKAKLEAMGEQASTAVEALPGEPDALAKLQWLNANEALFSADGGRGPGTPPTRRQLRQPKTPADRETEVPEPVIRF